MRSAIALLLVLATARPALGQDQAPGARVQTRRVTISLTFSGQEVFLYGQVMPGTERVLAVMEGPSAGAVRLMEKGRVAIFWPGVRQYRLTRVPAVYLVNVSCPVCNMRLPCHHPVDFALWNSALAPAGYMVGPDAFRAWAHLEPLSGELPSGEADRVLEGYWELQARRHLFAIRPNAIRVNADGVFYHRFALPAQAPEGKYRITTYFLAGHHLLGTAQNELFVRSSGFVAWLSRLADRQAFAYGVLTVLIAVTAGWVAGAVFKRGGRH